jgi:hypothetical protein
MVRIQCTAEECASIFECSVDTLDRRLKEAGFEGFADFYKKYSGEGKASLRRAQWKAAQDGNPTMLVWLGKQVLGQRDQVETKNTHEVVAFDGFEVRRAQSNPRHAD